ncbi:hypothetical protein L2E82_51342 [Cichorium intybus]|nr:hypothetical protein L2E82_51342 [Cichorium intybus]
MVAHIGTTIIAICTIVFTRYRRLHHHFSWFVMELHPDRNGSVNSDSDSDGFTTADCRAIQMVLSTVIASIYKSKLLIVLIFAGKRSHRLKEEKLKGGLKVRWHDPLIAS